MYRVFYDEKTFKNEHGTKKSERKKNIGRKKMRVSKKQVIFFTRFLLTQKLLTMSSNLSIKKVTWTLLLGNIFA